MTTLARDDDMVRLGCWQGRSETSGLQRLESPRPAGGLEVVIRHGEPAQMTPRFSFRATAGWRCHLLRRGNSIFQHREYNSENLLTPGTAKGLANPLQIRFPKPNAAGGND